MVCSGPGTLSPDFFSHRGSSSTGIGEKVTHACTFKKLSCKDVWEGRRQERQHGVFVGFFPRLMVGLINILSDDIKPNSANLL